ncbi:MAG: ABC transporter permease [Acutalibacteraceae bacterium]|nr:ABC transporter permease [Acutalibacteraceae bacterium]
MLDSIILSLRNIFRKGVRTSLTVLAVAVGVMSVMLINTISDAGIKTVNSELDSLGLNGISVSGDKCSVTNDDLKLIKQQKGIKNAMPILTSQSVAAKNDLSQDVMVWGVDSGAGQVIAINVLYGRSFENYEIEAKENVCLLDETAAEKIFKRQNAVGKTIDLFLGNSYEEFEIIGITESDSGILQSIMGNIVPTFCYVPYTTFQQATGVNELYQIAVKLEDESLAKSVSGNIKNVIDNEKGVSGSVKTGNLAAGRSTLDNLLKTITVVFSVVGIISLFVAGLGIMTIMLVSVNERTREIGIKKAIGASFMSIMTEFLSEALTICVIGSIIGTVIGFLCLQIGGYVVGMAIAVSPSTIIFSFLSAVAVGVLFGVYPAYKAAKMKVADALRYE